VAEGSQKTNFEGFEHAYGIASSRLYLQNIQIKLVAGLAMTVQASQVRLI